MSLRRELPGGGATLGTFPWHKSTPLCGSSHSWFHTASWSFMLQLGSTPKESLILFFLHLEGDRNPFSVSISGAAVSGARGLSWVSPLSSKLGMCLWGTTLGPAAEGRAM